VSPLISIEIEREVAEHLQEYFRRHTDMPLDPIAVDQFTGAVRDALILDDAEEEDK